MVDQRRYTPPLQSLHVLKGSLRRSRTSRKLEGDVMEVNTMSSRCSVSHGLTTVRSVVVRSSAKIAQSYGVAIRYEIAHTVPSRYKCM